MKLRLDLNDFDSCPQFNEWLDEEYDLKSGTLNIFSFKPRPSYVLYSLSQDTYQTCFADFQAQRQEELKQTVFDLFPSPIAHYFYRFENGYENEVQRLLLLRDTWESVVDVLHAIAVAECRFRNVLLEEPLAFSHILTDRMAQRLLNMERIIRHTEDRGVSLNVSRIISTGTIQTMRELNQTRNAFSHSAAQSERQARMWIGECYEDVLDVLDDLQDLSTLMILRYVGQVDANTLRCEVFRGHGFTRTFRNIHLPEALIHISHRYFRQGTILAYFGDCLCGLGPFIYHREDPTGHTTKLCLFRKARGAAPNRRIEYEIVGEATKWEEDRAIFKTDVDELRHLFGLPPD